MDQSRSDDGKFGIEYDPDDALEIMTVTEPYSTGELADALGWPQRSTFNTLDSLADSGAIRKKKPSATRAIWVRTE